MTLIRLMLYSQFKKLRSDVIKQVRGTTRCVCNIGDIRHRAHIGDIRHRALDI